MSVTPHQHLLVAFSNRGPGSGSLALASTLELRCNYCLYGYLLFLARDVSFPFMGGL